VDGYDVLFQRPLRDLVAAYRRLAEPAAKAAGGSWPVVFGGEQNCWPFPHEQTLPVHGADGRLLRVHRIPDYAMLSTSHNAHRHYFYGSQSPWSLRGDGFCGRWLENLAERRMQREGTSSTEVAFPFLCAGTFMGTVSALQRMLAYFFALVDETREYHDQSLFALLLLRNQSLGLVDTAGRLFLALHGHHELSDLDRRLCHDDYFAEGADSADVSRRRPTGAIRSLAGHMPPPLRGDDAADAPAVLHFNGNGKQHYPRCVNAFEAKGFVSGQTSSDMECVYFDVDRGKWAGVVQSSATVAELRGRLF